MLLCLACEKPILQMFQHMRQGYLICKTCFQQAVHQYGCNSFARVSLIGAPLPSRITNLQKQLLKFKEKEKIGVQSIFVIDIVDVYFSNKIQSSEPSTEYSLSIDTEGETITSSHYSQKYDWIKSKIWEQYEFLGKSANQYSQKLHDWSRKCEQKKNKASEKFQFIRKELYHLKREVPNISKVKLGSLLSGKYSQLL